MPPVSKTPRKLLVLDKTKYENFQVVCTDDPYFLLFTCNFQLLVIKQQLQISIIASSQHLHTACVS